MAPHIKVYSLRIDGILTVHASPFLILILIPERSEAHRQLIYSKSLHLTLSLGHIFDLFQCVQPWVNNSSHTYVQSLVFDKASVTHCPLPVKLNNILKLDPMLVLKQHARGENERTTIKNKESDNYTSTPSFLGSPKSH